MDEILHRLQQGQGGLVTFVGMVGVFIALTCLYLFTKAMNQLRLGVRRRGRSPTSAPPDPVPATGSEASAGPATTANSPEPELLAAAAAAAFLELRRHRPGAAVPPDRPVSAWRLAGRQQLMAGLSRRHG